MEKKKKKWPGGRGGVTQWSACRIRDLAVGGSIPTTVHFVIAFRKHFI